MTLEFYIIGSLIFLASAMLQGFTGFGFSILAIPLITLFISPKTTIPILVIYSVILNVLVFWSARKAFDLRKIWVLMLCGVIGVPIGAKLLITLNDNILKLFIGILITVFGTLLLLGFRREIKREKLSMIPIGIGSGILSGSVSIGGPPVILFMSNQGTGKEVFRASLSVYFLTLNVFTVPIYFLNGLITPEVTDYSVKFFPALVVGVIIGNLFSKKMKEKHFRKITLSLLIAMGVLSIISGLT
jgi:uncharacterized protein